MKGEGGEGRREKEGEGRREKGGRGEGGKRGRREGGKGGSQCCHHEWTGFSWQVWRVDVWA